jgi:hypothetical protein
MRTFAAHPPPSHVDRRRSNDLVPYKDQAYIPQSDHRSMPLVARDLWLIYLMVIENDGRNWSQLLKSAHVTGFLLNYFVRSTCSFFFFFSKPSLTFSECTVSSFSKSIV